MNPDRGRVSPLLDFKWGLEEGKTLQALCGGEGAGFVCAVLCAEGVGCSECCACGCSLSGCRSVCSWCIMCVSCRDACRCHR